MAFLSLFFCVIIAGAVGLPHRRSTDDTVCETDACRTVGKSEPTENIKLNVVKFYESCKRYEEYFDLSPDNDFMKASIVFGVAEWFQQSINKSIDPCTNLYEYGCGLWPSNNPIPSNDVQWSAFHLKDLQNSLRLKEVLEEESEYDQLDAVKKVKQYYRSCMDEDAIERQGLEPIQSILDSNNGWPIQLGNQESNYTWQEIDDAYIKMIFSSTFFQAAFLPAEEDATQNILTISQQVPSLFTEELVKRSDRKFKSSHINKVRNILKAFKEHKGIETPAEIFDEDITALLSFELDLKNISNHEEEIQKGIKKDQDKMTIAEFQEYYDQAGTQHPTAQINWLHKIQELLKPVDKVIDSSYPLLVYNKHLFHKLAHLLDATPSHVIVNYIQWNVVDQILPYLNKQMRDFDFEATYKSFNVTEQKPRWKICVTDIPLQDALSVLFIKKFHSPNTIPAVTEMLNDLKVEMKERILNSEWTNQNAKNFMIDKIDNIVSLIGYPEWYHNETALIKLYEGLEIGENYFNNKLASLTYQNMKGLKETFEPRNRSTWPVSPITLNAFYVGPLNLMVIPAAMIQDPFFTPNMPIAVNYGTVGMIVGHELAHSFDTTGIEYDKVGNKITSDAETSQAFDERVTCFINQYNNFTVVEDANGEPIKLNGLLTKDENVADNIGLDVAFSAFQKRKLKSGPQSKLLGLTDITDEQLFFLSFAQYWCAATTNEYKISSVNDDEHSPFEFRILGTVANMESFSNAFSCSANSTLNPDSKCNLWK